MYLTSMICFGPAQLHIRPECAVVVVPRGITEIHAKYAARGNQAFKYFNDSLGSNGIRRIRFEIKGKPT